MLELFVCGLMLVIGGFTLTLIGAITQHGIKNTVSECTEVTEGIYRGQVEVAREIVNRNGGRASAYAPLVEYEVGGDTWRVPAKYWEGIGTMSDPGLPVVVHYNPVDPTLCWANTPDARKRQAGAVSWLVRGGIAALALGAILVLVSFVLPTR